MGAGGAFSRGLTPAFEDASSRIGDLFSKLRAFLVRLAAEPGSPPSLTRAFIGAFEGAMRSRLTKCFY